MADYSATASEPFVQGLITVETVNGVPLVPVFRGKGVQLIARTVGGAAAGDYTLTLDRGLPGSVAVDPNLARTLLQVRGSLLAAPVGSTTIDGKAVDYIVSAVPGVAANQLRVVLTAAAVGTDPQDSDGDGCEIIVWRAQDSTFDQQIIGPLYQPVRFFP